SANKLGGTSDGGFAIAGGNAEAQLAVAPPGSARGPAGGIYVTASNAGAVAVFAPSGEYLGKLSGSGNVNPSSGGELCGVATDPPRHPFLCYFFWHVHK